MNRHLENALAALGGVACIVLPFLAFFLGFPA